MDHDEAERRFNIIAEAREGLANPGLLGERKMSQLADAPRAAKAEIVQRHSHYDDDDYPDDPLVEWHRGMVRSGAVEVSRPKQEVLPPLKPQLTDAETDRIEREMREALARYHSQAIIQSRVKSELAEHDELWRDVIGKLISDLRKQWRSEIVEQCGQLRADITVQKATEQREHDRAAEIVDMLVPLERKRRA